MFSISRRTFLTGSAAAACAAQDQAKRKLKVVVCGGHPGDPEYGCGGTVARYTASGHEVVLLYLNRGEKNCPAGPGDPGSTVRVAEAKKACRLLNAEPLFADQCDAHAVVDAAHYSAFRTLLEAQKPDVLFTQWPVDNHADHRAISMLAYEAWLRMGKRFGLYFYEVSNGEDTMMFTPTDYVDITATAARKREACYAHASQSPDRYYALQDQVAQFRGVESGHQRAEAFVRHVHSRNDLLP